jgi:solute carrier family 13 (sodium-dependent dicarboxylate transporter), member 2/3/5
MICSFFMSMWISNTATVLILMVSVQSIATVLKKNNPEINTELLAPALLIGLAYSASIGGMATLVGTPTNMIFAGFMQKFPDESMKIGFGDWLIKSFPIALLLLMFTFLILKFQFGIAFTRFLKGKTQFKEDYSALSKLNAGQKRVLIVFLITVLLWLFRTRLDLGAVIIPGWSEFLPYGKEIKDSTIAMLMALLLFIIPSGESQSNASLLNWQDTHKLPYGIIFVFGGGFALAKGFELSGLDNYLASKLHFLQGMPIFILLLGVCGIITLISEFASNVASIQLMLPILLPLSKTFDIPGYALLWPATLAASLGFMLPVATAPNTIVFSSGSIKALWMYKAGWWVNLAGVLLISLFFS